MVLNVEQEKFAGNQSRNGLKMKMIFQLATITKIHEQFYVSVWKQSLWIVERIYPWILHKYLWIEAKQSIAN